MRDIGHNRELSAWERLWKKELKFTACYTLNRQPVQQTTVNCLGGKAKAPSGGLRTLRTYQDLSLNVQLSLKIEKEESVPFVYDGENYNRGVFLSHPLLRSNSIKEL